MGEHRSIWCLDSISVFFFVCVSPVNPPNSLLYHSVSINKFIYTISVAETLFTFNAWMVTVNRSQIRFLLPCLGTIFSVSPYLFPAMAQSMAIDSNLSISRCHLENCFECDYLDDKMYPQRSKVTVSVCAEPLKSVLNDGHRRHKSFDTFHLRLVRIWWIFDNDEEI